jgi:U5 small nuclear ribonucleoprotein component
MSDPNNENNDDDDLYDEFGNYIGPELDSSSDEDDDSDDEKVVQAPDDASDVSHEEEPKGGAIMVASEGGGAASTQNTTADPMNAIVLHEDKDHYPSAMETFGEDVRTAVLDEDAMDLDTPIVQPILQKSHTVDDALTLTHKYTDEFMTNVLLSNETTQTRRSVAIIGHLHHGKTSLVDCLIESTLLVVEGEGFGPRAALEEQGPRVTDTLKAEQERQCSLKSTPITLCLPDTRGKTLGVTLVDCPGHIQFHDESVAALRLVDGALLVVDVVEGIMMHTELLIRQAVLEGLPILLCLSKLDRLIVELKLPPRDAYYKLLHTIESVNDLIAKASCGRYPHQLSPSKGNVCFSSALHGWMFTLESFAQVYADHHDDTVGNLTTAQLAQRLWGDWYWDPATRKFHDSPKDCTTRVTDRTFCSFILEPMYKIYSACLGEAEDDVNTLLRGLGVLLKREQLRASSRPLLRAALSKFLETAAGGWVDMVARHVPTPKAAAKGKLARGYSGPMDMESPIVQDLLACSSQGRLVVHVTKLYSSSDGSSFDAFGRIYSGTIQPGQRVKVLGEAYVPDEDEEDCAIATVEGVSIPRGRGQTPVTLATAGNWVLLKGIDATIAKTATIVGLQQDEDDMMQEQQKDPIHIFSPLKFPFAGGESVVKMALEPMQPAELPKMVEGLRRVSKSYPMVQTRVEESGEHVLFGTGELYLDCVLHDLRHVHADVEVKVADPIVAFRETVIETSSLKCFAEVRNTKGRKNEGKEKSVLSLRFRQHPLFSPNVRFDSIA